MRSGQGVQYNPPEHEGMVCLRAIGREAGASDQICISHLIFEPGGGTSMRSAAFEKMYIGILGTLQIITESAEVTLHPGDICRIAARESRAIRNVSEYEARALLVMPDDQAGVRLT